MVHAKHKEPSESLFAPFFEDHHSVDNIQSENKVITYLYIKSNMGNICTVEAHD